MGLGGNINSMCKEVAKMLPLSDREKELMCLVADALHDQTDLWEDLLADYDLDATERPIIQQLYDWDHRNEVAD